MYGIYDPAIAARKQRNAEIFRETLDVIRRGSYVSPAGNMVVLPPLSEMQEGSQCRHCAIPAGNYPLVPGGTKVMVEQNDCMDTAARLVSEGYRPALLNFASASHPGGGVGTGARAQEESICRRSTLTASIYIFDARYAARYGFPHRSGDNYPLSDLRHSVIYSPAVTFFREGLECTFMENPFQCAVITCAALNLNGKYALRLTGSGHMPEDAKDITTDKVRAIFRTALLHGHDALILGAFGCGAFRNPPLEVAGIFRSVLGEPEFVDRFSLVSFPIIEDHNSEGKNFRAFSQVFAREVE